MPSFQNFPTGSIIGSGTYKFRHYGEEAISIVPPTVTSNLTYNGASQSPTIVGFDSSTMLQTGTTTGTAAASYTVSFTPKEGYKWNDGTGTVTKDYSWSIAQKSISGATIALGASLTYNGSQQTQTISSVTIDGLTATYSASGNTGTNAGDYTLTCTGTGNFTGTQTKSWSIAKAAGSISLSTSTITITGEAGSTAAFTFTYTGDGTLSVTSSNTSAVTVSLSANTVTCRSVASGTSTITVAISAGTNYTSASATCTATATVVTFYRVGGQIFSDQGDNGCTYTFYDINRNVLSNQTVAGLATAYYYTIQGTPSTARWYIYDNSGQSPQEYKWLANGQSYNTTNTIGAGKTNTDNVINNTSESILQIYDSMFYWCLQQRRANLGGCNDWYIGTPIGITGFRSSIYGSLVDDKEVWSSHQSGSSNAYYSKSKLVTSTADRGRYKYAVLFRSI